MTEKSHVGLAYHVCPVCYKEHDPVVLLDKRLQNTLTNHEFAGFELCEEHEKMREEYIALVEVSNPPPQGEKLLPKDAKPTGNICHIRRHVFEHICSAKLPADLPMVYVEPGVLEKIQEMTSDPN